jgi:hypothetical protein
LNTNEKAKSHFATPLSCCLDASNTKEGLQKFIPYEEKQVDWMEDQLSLSCCLDASNTKEGLQKFRPYEEKQVDWKEDQLRMSIWRQHLKHVMRV